MSEVDGVGKGFMVASGVGSGTGALPRSREVPSALKRFIWAMAFMCALALLCGCSWVGSGSAGGNGDYAEASSAYAPIILAYGDALGKVEAPSDEYVNTNAHMVRSSPFSYAIRDINEDGVAELLIGVVGEADANGVSGSANYTLFDLYTLSNNTPVRVLDRGTMGSLGYRTSCIPCDGGVLAIRGSSSAKNMTREYMSFASADSPLVMLEGVEINDDEYTYVDENGVQYRFYGAEGQAKLEEMDSHYRALDISGWIPIAVSTSSSAESYERESASDQPEPSSDFQQSKGGVSQSGDWTTVSGTLERIEHTSEQTGAGWSRVVYNVVFSTPQTVKYTDAYGSETQVDLNRIAVAFTEQYGEDADKDLGSVVMDEWQPYVGYTVVVRGKLFDNGNAHTVGPVMLVDSQIAGTPGADGKYAGTP